MFITIDRKKREYKSVSIENSPALCRLSMIYSRNVLTAHKQLQTRLVSGDPFARNGRAIKTAKWPQRCDLIKELAVLTTAWQEGGDVEYAWCPKTTSQYWNCLVTLAENFRISNPIILFEFNDQHSCVLWGWVIKNGQNWALNPLTP